MKNITIEVTDAEYYAMQLISYSPEEWTENAVKNRARMAIDEIVDEIVHEKIENGETIQGTKEEILLSSNRKTAKELTDEIESQESDTP